MGKNVIEELLVSLGLDNDVKSFQEGSRLFDSVRAKALLFGGAVAGVAYGVNRMVMSFADSKDQLGKFQEVTGASAQFVDALGFALEKEGGQAEDAFGSVKRVLDLLRDIEMGDIGGYTDALLEGFDFTSVGQARDLADAYERIARATQGMDTESRRRALTDLGFSDAEIRLFAGGTEQMRQFFAEAERLGPVTQEMIENAAEINDATAELSKAITGLTDEFSNRLARSVSEFSRMLADLLADNRETIVDTTFKGVDKFSDMMLGGLPGAFTGEGKSFWFDRFQEGRGLLEDFFGNANQRRMEYAPQTRNDDLEMFNNLNLVPQARGNQSISNQYDVKVELNGVSGVTAQTEVALKRVVLEALAEASERSVEITEGPLR